MWWEVSKERMCGVWQKDSWKMEGSSARSVGTRVPEMEWREVRASMAVMKKGVGRRGGGGREREELSQLVAGRGGERERETERTVHGMPHLVENSLDFLIRQKRRSTDERRESKVAIQDGDRKLEAPFSSLSLHRHHLQSSSPDTPTRFATSSEEPSPPSPLPHLLPHILLIPFEIIVVHPPRSG